MNLCDQDLGWGDRKHEKNVKVKSLSRVRLFATMWTVACQVLPSMGLCRQQYWSGLPFPSPGDLPDPGIKPGSPTLLPHCRQTLNCLSHQGSPHKRTGQQSYQCSLRMWPQMTMGSLNGSTTVEAGCNGEMLCLGL